MKSLLGILLLAFFMISVNEIQARDLSDSSSNTSLLIIEHHGGYGPHGPHGGCGR